MSIEVRSGVDAEVNRSATLGSIPQTTASQPRQPPKLTGAYKVSLLKLKKRSSRPVRTSSMPALLQVMSIACHKCGATFPARTSCRSIGMARLCQSKKSKNDASNTHSVRLLRRNHACAYAPSCYHPLWSNRNGTARSSHLPSNCRLALQHSSVAGIFDGAIVVICWCGYGRSAQPRRYRAQNLEVARRHCANRQMKCGNAP